MAESLKIDNVKYLQKLASALIYKEAGKITKSVGLICEAHLPGASVGSICEIFPHTSAVGVKGFKAEVIGFKDKRSILMPLEETYGINNGSLVVLSNRSSTFMVGPHLLGRVLNARGTPIDDLGPLEFSGSGVEERNLYEKAEDPLKRKLIEEPLDLGIRSINGLLTCGKGQRVGIMAGSGVGKSVLLGMMARNTSADINVIALIGERGREVREFIERDLGPEGLKRSIVIVATSDTPALLRMRGAYLATTIAEYFRDLGKDVLLMMDSVTRFAMAQREIGLSMGEPPASKGYTPSVFAKLPKLLERAGTSSKGKGSITGLYTVLVEGDELDDPIADSARSILDGHYVLSRKLAEKNHFPAVDVLQSTSRVMPSIVNDEQLKWVGQIRELIAIYKDAEDLINIGAYVRGSNPKIDLAIEVNDRINTFLRQGIKEKVAYKDTVAIMHSIVRAVEAFYGARASGGQKMNPQQGSKISL